MVNRSWLFAILLATEQAEVVLQLVSTHIALPLRRVHLLWLEYLWLDMFHNLLFIQVGIAANDLGYDGERGHE